MWKDLLNYYRNQYNLNPDINKLTKTESLVCPSCTNNNNNNNMPHILIFVYNSVAVDTVVKFKPIGAQLEECG